MAPLTTALTNGYLLEKTAPLAALWLFSAKTAQLAADTSKTVPLEAQVKACLESRKWSQKRVASGAECTGPWIVQIS